MNIPEYSVESGLQTEWELGFDIETKTNDGTISIIANKAGLISLAKQLLTLAQENVPVGRHLHFDEYNSLEEGSIELVIQKK